MAKKEPSPAQLAARAKFAAAAKARAEAKKEQVTPTQATPSLATPTPSQPDSNDVDKLWKYIQELEGRLALPQVAPAQPFTPVKSITKYSVNAVDYPDPRNRLFNEERLKLKNFNSTWWGLEYKVDRVQYDKDGVHYVEPRFTLELWRIMENEDGEPSTKKYKVCTGMFFEDPESYVIIANERGIDVPEDVQGEFCNEMRYLSMRDWLIEAFYPPKPQNTNQRTELVIGNRLVEVVEENSPDAKSASALLSKA